jgi:hypothetical protein
VAKTLYGYDNPAAVIAAFFRRKLYPYITQSVSVSLVEAKALDGGHSAPVFIALFNVRKS